MDTNTVKCCTLNLTTGLSPEVYSYTDSKMLILSDQHGRDANKTEMNTVGDGVGALGIGVYSIQQSAEGMCLRFQSQLVRKKIPA